MGGYPSHKYKPVTAIARVGAMLLALLAFAAADAASAKSRLSEFTALVSPQDVFPGATRFGDPQGDPPIVPVFAAVQLQGYVYLNSDFAVATGYSGKPVNILVGIDTTGVVRGIKLVEHKEPIVLVGVPEARVVAAINKLIGLEIAPVAAGKERAPQPDIVSGATVTILVMADSVVRSAVRLWRSGRLSPAEAGAAPRPTAEAEKVINQEEEGEEEQDWPTLLKQGSIARLHLTVSYVNRAFERSGNAAAAANPQPGGPDDTFIDLYVSLVSVPAIGESLLGEEAYKQLKHRLKPGQQAILVAGNGLYSFKGSGYVRGGIFDRIELLQDGSGTRFRDRNQERLGNVAAASAPTFREISVFTVPEDFAFEPTEPWELQLLVQRVTGVRDKAFLTFNLPYNLPDRYIRRVSRAPTPTAEKREHERSIEAAAPPASAAGQGEEDPLWKQMWRRNTASVAITGLAILVLTAIFFFQNQLVRRPRLYTWVRRGFLAFTLIWLGWYANAQLSVVNVLTFSNALITGFSWEYFLTSPLIFILWSAVAVGLLFWGRGPFCGWLCPFGALQELTNNIAKALGVPQIRVPWGLHERLWPIKYIIFLFLFGMSLYSIAFAERLSEVEPFKTAIVLKFLREWPFVVYAAALLGAGLFIERFFCRYLCPLGAALAIPGRGRMFEWLRRWPECGKPCQRCANECPVQSIHPEGHINVNECIYCMHCQELYWDDQRCPHMIQIRLKRAKRDALSSPSMRVSTSPKPSIFASLFQRKELDAGKARVRQVVDALRRRLSWKSKQTNVG
jgi:NosR/NirI family nitrous oxide reductase transcriptional regulator